MGDDHDNLAIPEDFCEHSGHEWADAGGGLEMCLSCDAERWVDAPPLEPQGEDGPRDG